MRRISSGDLMRSDELKLVNKSQPLIGSMNMFFYDAKHKETLPYFDRFPLSIIVKGAPGGFIGLNLHYLPPVLRAKMLDGLMETVNNKRYDETTKFQITYNLLQATARLKFYKPCLKRYLFSQVKSRLARVEAPEWEIATFLPTADWSGSSSNKVYQDSRKII